MKASDYTSNYMTGDDARKPLLLHIENVTEESIGNDTKAKLVVYARVDETGDEVKIALNKTNIDKLIEIFNDDETDNWIGLSVVVYRDPNVMFQNKKVGGLAFRTPKNGVNSKTKSNAAVDTSFDTDSL